MSGRGRGGHFRGGQRGGFRGGFRGYRGGRGRGHPGNFHNPTRRPVSSNPPRGFLVVAKKPITESMIPEIVEFLEKYPDASTDGNNAVDGQSNTAEASSNGTEASKSNNVMDVSSDPTYVPVKGSYESLNLKPELLSAVLGAGFEQPALVDENVMRAIISGKNVVTEIPLLKTAKRMLMYVTSALQVVDPSLREAQLLIVVRTRSLASDMQQKLASVGDKIGVGSCVCVGGLEISEDFAALSKGPQVVLGTPGRIFDLLRRGALNQKVVRTLIVDDADPMLQAGFGEHVFKIIRILRNQSQMVFASGTALYIATLIERLSPRASIRLSARCQSVSADGSQANSDEQNNSSESCIQIGTSVLLNLHYFLHQSEISSNVIPTVADGKGDASLLFEEPIVESTEISVEDTEDVPKSGNEENEMASPLVAKENLQKSADTATTENSSPNKVQSRQDTKRKQYHQMQSATAHMPKPQLNFKIPVINDDSPFKPKLTSKPHSVEPLSLLPQEHPQNGKIFFEHPYKAEIAGWSPPEFSLQLPEDGCSYQTVEQSSYLIVDSDETLEQMMEEMKEEKELGFDVEHSDRSFFGLTCLLQLSTRTKDYLIDCLALRDSLHKLNEYFTNPAVIKIAHDGRCDVEYIQKCLGLYIVGLWDTRTAEALLTSQQNTGLAALLEKYVGVQTDKKYQVADWRIRPLPEDMVQYARTDSRYLVQIYDKQKQALWTAGKDSVKLIQQVFQSAKGVCGIRYEKPDLQDWVARNRNLNNQQMYALTELSNWRTEVAKLEDDSVYQIASNKVLVTVSTALPLTEDDMEYAVNKAQSGRISSHMRRDIERILNIFADAKSLPLVDLREEEKKRKVVGRYNPKPQLGTKEHYFGSKVDSSLTVGKIMADSLAGKSDHPTYISKILPTQGGCKDIPGDIALTLKSLLTPFVLSGTSSMPYDILVNETDERHSDQLKTIQDIVSSILPTWFRKRPASRCIIVYSSKRYCNLAVVDHSDEYNLFNLERKEDS